MLEKQHQSVLPGRAFAKRFTLSICVALLIITISLFSGMIGYRYFENMNWVDSFVNAAMILSGMGPVSTLATDHGKIFAGFYALFSGIIFLAVIVIIATPLFHRFLHKFLMKDTK